MRQASGRSAYWSCRACWIEQGGPDRVTSAYPTSNTNLLTLGILFFSWVLDSVCGCVKLGRGEASGYHLSINDVPAWLCEKRGKPLFDKGKKPSGQAAQAPGCQPEANSQTQRGKGP